MNTTTLEVPASAPTPPVGSPKYQRRLDPTEFPDAPSGQSKPPLTLENMAHLLKETGITARFDVIKKRVLVERADGTMASENDIASLANLNRMQGAWLQSFIYEIANRNRYNPVADWIASKGWDGIDRLHEFYSTVQAAEGYPANLKETLLHR